MMGRLELAAVETKILSTRFQHWLILNPPYIVEVHCN